ncbi:Uncharacterised protein [Mycobacteroides abscessus subsp. abscessus]|nr:Uncharacterised protein [Mycobacteroides abscessus subsp. abscessus]
MSCRGLEVNGIADDDVRACQPQHLADIALTGEKYGDRAQPGQCGNRDQRARAGVHQNPDVLAGAHATLHQSRHHVVDAGVDLRMGENSILEEENLAVAAPVGVLRHQLSQRDTST